MRGKKVKPADPLYQLFEHHLAHRSYEDSGAFTKEVAQGYIAYLDSTEAHIPLHVRQGVLEELEVETHEMLVKKMYGVVKATDNTNFGRVVKVTKDEILTVDYHAPAHPVKSTTENEDK